MAVVQYRSLDNVSTERLQEEVTAAAGQARDLPVILDLAKLRFMPSLSIGALVNLARECRENNQRFALAGVQPQIREALAVTRLDKLFEMYDDVDSAIAQVRASS